MGLPRGSREEKPERKPSLKTKSKGLVFSDTIREQTHQKGKKATKGDRPAKPKRTRFRDQVPAHTVTVTNLEGNLKNVYQRALDTALQLQRDGKGRVGEHGKKSVLPYELKAIDGDMMLIKLPNAKAANYAKSRLTNMTVFGKKWKIEKYSKAQFESQTTPIVVQVLPSEAVPLPAVEGTLLRLPGFLAVRPSDEDLDEGRCRVLFATFADEGTALHARATTSGMVCHGTDSTRLFLSLIRSEA